MKMTRTLCVGEMCIRDSYKAEILDEDEYSQLKEHYIAEKQRLEHELQKQRQRALELEKRIKICDAQMERMRGILNQSEFDEELVHELIKRIYVGTVSYTHLAR